MKKLALWILMIAVLMSLGMGVSLAQQAPPTNQQQGNTWICPRTGQPVQAGACPGCGQRMRYRGGRNCPAWQNTTGQSGAPAGQGSAATPNSAGSNQ